MRERLMATSVLLHADVELVQRGQVKELGQTVELTASVEPANQRNSALEPHHETARMRELPPHYDSSKQLAASLLANRSWLDLLLSQGERVQLVLAPNLVPPRGLFLVFSLPREYGADATRIRLESGMTEHLNATQRAPSPERRPRGSQ